MYGRANMFAGAAVIVANESQGKLIIYSREMDVHPRSEKKSQFTCRNTSGYLEVSGKIKILKGG